MSENLKNRDEAEKVKASLNIVDVIGKTIKLTHSSEGLYVGATSSLSKSGASLKVDQNLQLWHDLSGRAQPTGGDVFSWIAYEHNLDIKDDFSQILKIAADLAGIQLKEISVEQTEKIQKTRSIHNILTCAAEAYHSYLTPEIRSYINKKWGISNETIDRLKIGYAQPGQGNINLGKVANSDEWTESGLFHVVSIINPKENGPTQTAHEIFKGRVVFPYWQGGKVVNFAARGDFADPINTPDSKYEKNGDTIIKYKKLLTCNEKHPYVAECVNNSYLFGEDTLKGNDSCIITEGIADSIVLMQNGYPVLSPITTKFAKHDIERLLHAAKRMKTVYICNDNEDSGAGEDGAIRTGLLLKSEKIDVKIMMLPKENLDKMDIAEYFLRHTKNEFEVVKDESRDILVHLLGKVQPSTYNDVTLAKTENVRKATEFVKNILRTIKDEDEATLFIRNNIKNYFPRFTNDDTKTLVKVYKNSVMEDVNQNPETSLQFDLDSESGRSLMTNILASETLKQQSIKYVAGALRVYKEGIYVSSADVLNKLQRDIMTLALCNHRTPIMEKHVKNVMGVLSIKTGISQNECSTADNELAVNNGILNLETFELSEFTPDKVFFNKLPVDYLPNAPKPTQFLQLMESVFKGNEEQYNLMQEVFGYCLLNNYKYQVIIYLLGDGGNGKGTVLKILTYLLGLENTSSATLFQLTDHQNVEYYLSGLYGKRANICGDVGSKRIENTENVKKLSSNTDLISARQPYGMPFEFINTAKIIFAMNKMPKKDAFTTGDKRRDVIISFNNRISDTAQEVRGLSEIIRDAGELPGVLNWAIEGLKRLERNQKFSDKRTIAQRGLEYDMKSNPMKYFVDDCIEVDPKGGNLPNMLIYNAYAEYRKLHGLPELSDTELKNGLKYWCSQIGIQTSEKREYAEKLLGFELTKDLKERLGRRPHVFTGIKLTVDIEGSQKKLDFIKEKDTTKITAEKTELESDFEKAFCK